ncbi:roadblock/LC7 domain-containing protein [Streptomyces polygonati]|uniref:Roadblock/LC7 domain-containing protein n=1 Tax=Streptomyces polygonati TaxID=1617087 RepID=A0ABV8HNW6_9ACTN
MNAVRTYTSDLSHEARNIQWLLQNFVEEVPGVHSVAVVSSDGLLLLTSNTEPPAAGPGADPGAAPTVPGQGGAAARPGADSRMDLAAVVSGLASLTVGAARLMDGGSVRQTTVAMADGMLFVTAISDGSLLGVHATADADISVIGYHMALFVGRVGHVLTPALRTELRHAMESAS